MLGFLKKPKDEIKKLIAAKDEKTKKLFCLKQIEYFRYKGAKGGFKYDFSQLLPEIEILKNSNSLDCKLVWLLLVNEIMLINPYYKENLHKDIFSIIFGSIFDDNELKREVIFILTDKCKNFFTFSENENKKIIFFLVNEIMQKGETIELIESIVNFFENMKIDNIYFYLKNFMDLFCVFAIKNIIKKKGKRESSKNDIQTKISLYIRLFKVYLNKYPSISTHSIIDKILLILCQLNGNNNEERWNILSNCLIFKTDEDYIIRRLLLLFNIDKVSNLFSRCKTNFEYIYEDTNNFMKNYFKLKQKFPDIQNKIKNKDIEIYKGILFFFKKYLCFYQSKNNNGKNKFLIILLCNLKTLYTNNIIHDSILNLIEDIIQYYGSIMITEWEVINEILSFDSSNAICYSIIMRIFYLKINQKFKGTEEMFRNIILSQRNSNENKMLNLMKIKLLLSVKESYNIEMPNILIDIKNIQDMINFYYILTFMTLYVNNITTEKLIIVNMENFCNIMKQSPTTAKELNKFFIGFLIKTNKFDVFSMIAEKILTKMNITNSTHNENTELFGKKFLYKLIKHLNYTYQAQKIKIIFTLVSDIIINKSEKLNDFFILSFLYIFERMVFFKRNKKIFISFSKFYSDSKDSNISIKNKNIPKSSVIILEDMNNKNKKYETNKYFTLYRNELNTLFFDKILNKTKKTAIIETFIKILSNQLNRVYFLQLNIEKLNNFIFEHICNHNDHFYPIERYSQNILINLILILKNSPMKVRIMEKILIKIKEIQTTIFQIIKEKESDIQTKTQRDQNDLLNIISNPIFSNSIKYLQIFFNILSIYLYSIGIIEPLDKKNKDFLCNINDISLSLYPQKKIESNELINLSYQIIKIIFHCKKIIHYKKSFVIPVVNLIDYSREFFTMCNEENEIQMIYFLCLLLFPENEEIFYEKFTSNFSIKNIQLCEKVKNPNNKISRHFKFYNFLIECVILSYLENSSFNFQLHKLLEAIINNIVNKVKYKTFLSLCKLLSIFKGKEKEIGFNLYMQNKSQKKIILNGNKFNLSLMNDIITIRTPISFDVIKTNKKGKTYSQIVESNIKKLSSNLKIRKKAVDEENEENLPRYEDNLNIPSKEEGIVNILKSLNNDPFYLNLIQSDTINNFDNSSLFIIIPVSTIYISNTMAFYTKDDIKLVHVNEIIKSKKKSKFPLLMDSIGYFQGNCYIATTFLFKTKYNLFQLKDCAETESISLIFIEKDNKKRNHLNNFNPEIMNSKSIIVFLVIYQISKDVWLVKRIFNNIVRMNEKISRIQKMISSNFSDEVLFDVSNGFHLISSYINKMTIFCFLVVKNEMKISESTFDFDKEFINSKEFSEL